MITRFKVLLVCILSIGLGVVGASAAESSAKSFVEGIYAAYKGKDARGVSLESNAAVRRYFDRKLAALIITYVATNLPIVIWLMRDYFLTVPLELEESASVDGASPFRIFRSIVLPVSLPGLVATFLFVLVFAWNEYLLAVFLSASDTRTMPLTVVAQDATRGPQWWFMSVLVLIMIIPVIIMAIVLERYISKGILVGAVKG